jgi:hypothetical protein
LIGTQQKHNQEQSHPMTGDCDMPPFADMHKVMTLVQEDDNQRHNAVFRLLRCIPELCPFAGRNGSAADE